jgi:hypothetical protein
VTGSEHPKTEDMDAVVQSPLAKGELRRKELHGTVATYRVVDLADEHALVEVVDAPGLDAGARFWFTQDAVGAMTLVAAGTPAPQQR